MRKKLIDIISEIANKPKNISYVKTKEDPETGSIEWDVKYDIEPPKTYEFRDSYKEIDSFVKNLISLNGRLKPTDPKLEELLLIAKNFKNRYHRYLRSYQPDWDK